MSWATDGQGTPWGPTTYGRPQTPDLMTNPYDKSIQGLDQGPLYQSMMQRIGQGVGRQQESGQASLAKAGIYNSSQQGALGRDIADQASENQNAAANQLMQQDYQNRLGLMNENNNNAVGMYGINSGNYNQEQSNRNQFWGGMLGTGAQLAGMYMGSKMMPWGQQGYNNPDVNVQVPQFNWSPSI